MTNNSPSLEQNSVQPLEVGPWTKGSLTSLGGLVAGSLDLMHQRSPIEYTRGEGTSYQIDRWGDSLTSVYADEGQVAISLSTIGHRWHIGVTRDADAVTVAIDIRRKGRRRATESLVVTYNEGVPSGISALEEMSQERILQILSKSLKVVSVANLHIADKAKSQLVRSSSEVLSDTEIVQQAHQDIEVAMTESPDESDIDPVEAATITDIKEHNKFPQNISITGTFVQAIQVLRSISDGADRRQRQYKGRELGLVFLRKTGFYLPSNFSLFNASLPLQQRCIIGDERSINGRFHELQQFIPTSLIDPMKADLHLHPFMSDEESAAYVKEGVILNRNMLNDWNMHIATPEGRQVLIDALAVIPPSYNDIVTASMYKYGGMSVVSSFGGVYVLANAARTKQVHNDSNVQVQQENQNRIYGEIILECIRRVESGQTITRKQIQIAMLQCVKRMCNNLQMCLYQGDWASDLTQINLHRKA